MIWPDEIHDARAFDVPRPLSRWVAYPLTAAIGALLWLALIEAFL